MTDIGKEIVKLIKEREEMCYNGILCDECEIIKFKEDFGLKSVNCDAVYMVIKLLGYNKHSAEYYMDQRYRLDEICDENDRKCHTCKFREETEGINCLCYIIGNDLLRDV